MHRTNRNNAIRFENLEQALARDPETYGHPDILTAGWPCQDNSIAGRRKGLQGEKSGLWREVKRVIGILSPEWLVLENVPGLFSVNVGRDFWTVISDLDSLGYCVAWDVLDSSNFGLAQQRRRVFIVGSLGHAGAAQVLFEPESRGGNVEKSKKMGIKGLCLHAGGNNKCCAKRENIIANTIGAKEGQNNHPTTQTYISCTVRSHDNVNSSTARGKQNIIAEIDTRRKGETPGPSRSLDTRRGIVIGNAVSVPVARWIAERIKKYAGQG